MKEDRLPELTFDDLSAMAAARHCRFEELLLQTLRERADARAAKRPRDDRQRDALHLLSPAQAAAKPR